MRLFNKVDTGSIRRITISNESTFFIRRRVAYSFIHGNSSRQGIPGFIDMVGGNLAAFSTDKEKGVIIFTRYFDICFIACLDAISLTLFGEIKLMAVISSRFGVIKDSLIGAGNREYIP